MQSLGILNFDLQTSPNPLCTQPKSKVMWFVRCPKSSKETGIKQAVSSQTSFHSWNRCPNMTIHRSILAPLEHPQIVRLKVLWNGGKKNSGRFAAPSLARNACGIPVVESHVFTTSQLPSGKLTFCYGKWPFGMANSTQQCPKSLSHSNTLVGLYGFP